MVEEKIETYLAQLKSLDVLSLSLIEEIRSLQVKNQALEQELSTASTQSNHPDLSTELEAMTKERDALKTENETLVTAMEELSKNLSLSTVQPKTAKKSSAKKVDNAPSLF